MIYILLNDLKITNNVEKTAECLKCDKMRMVNGELIRIWEEAIVTYLK